MFHHLYCAGRRLRILAFAGTDALAISQPLWSASCVGPAPLEARVHSHPDADAYELWAFGSVRTANPNAPPRPFKLDSSWSPTRLASLISSD